VSAYAKLADRMRPVCREAVDVMEVAAVLESDGVTDALAQSRYGSPDVFHLAERLCADIPRDPSPSVPVDGPWRSRGLEHLLRGALFGLPALCFLAVSGVATGRAAGLLMVVSVLLSWAVGQALAYLGHVRLGWAEQAGAARVLRGGLLAGTAGVLAVIGVLAVALDVPLPVVGIAAAQVVYLLAATVALVLKAELLLLAALAPGVLAAVTGLLIGDGAVRSAPVVLGAVVTVLACAALAWWVTRGVRPGVPGRAELVASLPHALFGLSVGGLLLFVPAAQTLPPAGTVVLPPSGAAAGLAALVPLSISMGLAELLLVRYRVRTHRDLQRATTLREFGRRAGAALGCHVAAYVAALAGACVAAAVLVRAITGDTPSAAALTGYVGLGGALFVALTLMSFGVRTVAVAAVTAAVVTEGALLAVHDDPGPIQLGVTGALFAGLLLHALSALGRAARHI
jgi:hypothetical protein